MAEEDMIFGKNRHFFGGIEPSNMKKFSVTAENGAVNIVAMLPEDTIVDGQTLCSVAGTVIRRKSNGFPKDEFDGELVLNAAESLTFTDTSIDATDRYYYAAFPYTTQGVYNRNTVNRASINAEAMVLSAETTLNPPAVKLNYTIPDGYSGVVIRKGTMGYPETETDGEEIGNFTSSGFYTDTNVEKGLIYLYSFFPYDSGGTYLYDERNRISVQTPTGDYLFGYDLTVATPNPSTRVVYPEDVENYGFTPAAMDFGAGQFKPGSWDLNAGSYFMPKPCMLKYDGTVAYYLDPNDYSKREDGQASDIANTEFGGNAMMEWPKIYTKRWEENGVYHFRCSSIKHDTDWDCWCNYDRNDNETEHFYTPIYLGSVVSNRLRSISGVTPTGSNTADTEITYAKANGNDWYTEVLADHLLIQDLLVMIGKSTNGQSVFGSGNFSNHTTGTTNTNGLFYGSSADASGPLKIFGMEDPWGYYGRRIAGWIFQQSSMGGSGTHMVKLTRGIRDGSAANDYNTTGTGYISAGDSPSGGGYISSMINKEYGRLPNGTNSSGTTYECDYFYAGNTAGTYYAIVGWNYMGYSTSGPFYADLYYAPSYTNATLVASISCKPLAAT